MFKAWIPAFAGMTMALSIPCAVTGTDAGPQGYVTDQANVLKDETRQQLESLLTQFEQRSTVQIAVVTLPSLDGDDVNNVAVELFKKWGIGKKGKDNGVLFLIAPNERKMRIEVGYGLESVLPDALAGRILDEAVVPRFKSGDIDGGIVAGTAMICRTIAEKSNIDLSNLKDLPNEAPPQAANNQLSPWISLLIILVIFLVFGRNPLFWFFFMTNNNRRNGGWGGGGFGGGGFGGFGGGMSGGGGASRGW